MKSAAIPNGSGPGSSIALSPTSIRVRDAIIEKFIDKSLDELNNFLASALDTERDESKRIGILAARVYILRTRISKIMEFNQNSMIPAIEAVSPHELVNNPQNSDNAVMDNEDLAESAEHLEEWNELMTIEAGEVNGVRIPSGVAITVGRDDAVRLIETGKAKLITEEESEGREPGEAVTPDASDIQEMETESAEQMSAETTDELSADKEETVPESVVQDTKTEIEAAEQMPAETTDELSADKEETVPESVVQDTKTEIEATEQMPAEQTDELSADKEETVPESVVQDTKTEIEATEQMPAEQTDEISADDIELTPETTVEDSDMSASKTTAGDIETKPKESSSSEDTQSDDVDEAKIDDTEPKT